MCIKFNTFSCRSIWKLQRSYFQQNYISRFINSSSRMMDTKTKILMPPSEVRGMTILKKDAFTKTISVPSIEIKLTDMGQACKLLKKYFIKLKNFQSVVGSVQDNLNSRNIMLDPDIIDDKQIDAILQTTGIECKISKTEVKITYDNWKAKHVMESVLPEGESTTSYSSIGHIMHLNLREHLLPYKFLIGQVYLDKTIGYSLVINKDNIIDDSDNTFRTFSMEKLAGDTDNTIVTVSENGCSFSFDFAKVYWNPRLSTEHERVLKKLNKYDILYDVMCGVGPFSIPAAKKKCTVLANDLNPHSYENLKGNCKLNKIGSNIQCFNLDGKDFIQTNVKEHLKIIFEDPDNYRSIHVTMNLPSIAIEFLPYFIGLFDENFPKFKRDDYNEDVKPYLPLVHVYLFSYIELQEAAQYMVAEKLNYTNRVFNIGLVEDKEGITADNLKNSIDPHFLEHIDEIIKVRVVSTSKIMYRVSFFVPLQTLIKSDSQDIPSKRIKLTN